MRVLLATTWGTACGIAEHSAMLKAAVEAADPGIDILPDPEALDPDRVLAREAWIDPKDDIVHLNYHAALHSRWTRDAVAAVQAAGCKVVVTYHDTIGEIAPEDLAAKGDTRLDRLADLCDLVDALVVHEPCEGLPIDEHYYWRMGVPAWKPGYQFAEHMQQSHWQTGGVDFKGWRDQPVLGTVGFSFPWKNYERLASITRQAGWALLLVAPNATPEQIARWTQLNPDLLVRADFVPRQEAISLLAGCDATAFAYTCGNTGQSAAIGLGIAARKPVLALATCRQFRALFADPLGRTAISWCETLEDFAFTLSHLTPIVRVAPAVVALAEQDSWERLGKRYAKLYREIGA